MLSSHFNTKMRDLVPEASFVGGEWIKEGEATAISVMNPADGAEIACVPDVGASGTQRAIDAAESAFKGWRELAAAERSRLLRRWRDDVVENADDLAKVLTLEQGKPLAEARGEILYGASFIEWFAEEAKRVYGDTIPAPKAGSRIIVQKQPIGVAGCIIPWNFPSALFCRKAAAALAAGCPVIVKPSEFTPLSAIALARLAELAGLPAGVMNVVTGMPEPIAREIMSSPVVRKVSFTGSTRVGKLLIEQSADTVKKLSLELGGNAPLIVFDDADVPTAVASCMNSKFRNSGQTCVCANRIYVQSGIKDEFLAALSSAVNALNVGPGDAVGSQIGPLINDAAIQKVEAHIKDATAKGATVLMGGSRHSLGGRYFQPTILGNATAEMELANDETFGPVAPIFDFATEGEAIQMANDTRYGLAAYIFTQDIDRMWRVADALDTGMVGINEGLISNEVAPFGGVKESGLGREGSRYGIEEYLEMKYLMISERVKNNE